MDIDLGPDEKDSAEPAISDEVRTAIDQADGRTHDERSENVLREKQSEVRDKQEQLKNLDARLQSLETTHDGLEYTLTRLDEADSSQLVMQTLEGGVSVEVDDREQVREDIEKQKAEVEETILEIEERIEEVEESLQEGAELLEELESLHTARQ